MAVRTRAIDCVYLPGHIRVMSGFKIVWRSTNSLLGTRTIFEIQGTAMGFESTIAKFVNKHPNDWVVSNYLNGAIDCVHLSCHIRVLSAFSLGDDKYTQWITLRENCPYLEFLWSVFSRFSLNAEKYRSEKLRIQALFKYCNAVQKSNHNTAKSFDQFL